MESLYRKWEWAWKKLFLRLFPVRIKRMKNFKACGGVLLVATGFRMMNVKEFPIADMIPAMVLVMPLSHLWVTYVMPFVS